MTKTGTYRVNRYRVALVREGTIPTTWDRHLSNAGDVVQVLTPMIEDADREQFIVAAVDSKNRLCGVNIAHVGTLNMTLAHPREVFKFAILVNAAAIIVAHNHPSGDPTPSPEDRAVTARLLKAGEIIGIPLLDSLVLTASGHFRSVGA